MGEIQPAEAFKAKYQVDEVSFSSQLKQVLDSMKPSRLFILYGQNTDSGSFTKTTADFEGISEFQVDRQLLHPVITECRVFKSEMEMEVMRYANKVSSGAHREVMRNVRPGAFEFQMESIFHGDYKSLLF